MKLKIYLYFLFLSIFSSAFAQGTIQGKVFDAVTNTPLSGATISFAGTGGTVTDKDGLFTIDCSKSSTIEVSFVGYKTYKYTIKNCNDKLSLALTPTSTNLNIVEITATSSANKSLLYQPVSITKLSETEIKRGTGLFLDDAINMNVPGVTLQRRAVSSGQQFNIRGYGNGSRGPRGVSSNFDGQGYKVYLNNIPITDAEGITVLDDIDFGSIGNVEVTKGPAGSLYGLAIAGAVNLKTVKPEKGKTSIGQDVLIGNYGLQRYTTHFQTATDRTSLLVNYGHQKSDGFMNHSASRKDFINIAGEFQPNEKQTISTYFGYSNSYDERAGELTIAQYNAKDYTGNPNYIKNNAHSNVISFRAGLGHTYNFTYNISNTTTVFGSGVTNNASSAGGWTDKTPVNYGLRSTFDTKFSLANNVSLSGITGVETQQQNAQTIGYSMITNRANRNDYNIIGGFTINNVTKDTIYNSGTTSNIYTVTKTTSLFTDWNLGLPGDFSVTAGVGVSNMYIELNDRIYVPNKPIYFEKTYNGMVSPHIALNKVFSKQFSLYASYSKAYKAPVSSYFYIPYVATAAAGTGKVNTDLKSEIGNQYEIGSKGSLINDKLTYELAVFNAIFSNKMTAVAVPLQGSTTTTGYTYMVNGGKQNHKGVEALVRYAVLQSAGGFFRTIRPFANLAYSDFKYEDFRIQKSVVLTEDYSGKAVAGVAKITANMGIDLAMKHGIYANVTYMYKDKMPITSDELLYTTSYNLLNAKIGINHSLSKHFDVDVYFGTDNITNTQFPYMVFVNQIPDAYLPAPLKANYYGGINLKYNF
jgi:iron complex outermembrane receptor protein